MNGNTVTIHGVVARGHGVASRKSAYYPSGTIKMQKPFFKERGLDLTPYKNGTLNVSISPSIFKMIHAEFTFRNVTWTDLHPPEHFSFSRCKVQFSGVEYDGWVYYPHPETKERHFQDPSILEIIAQKIPGIKVGDKVAVELNPQEILIT